MYKDPEQLINWKQAIKILGCSKSHFYNLVNSGDLPAQRFGKTKGVRVKRADCENYKKNWDERYDFHLENRSSI